MAIYHLKFKNISRSEGRTSIASAAYRAGEKLFSEYEGIYHDYSRKGFVVHSEIQLPPNAPKAYQDRQTLWNSSEASENAKDARVAREVEAALPVELDIEQQKDLVREYVEENYVSKGMCTDWSIHNPPARDDLKRPINKDGFPTKDESEMIFQNPHVHIMLTVRGIDETGQWEPKTQTEYLCINPEGIERGLTATELKDRASEGWQKQYRYRNGANLVWLTKEKGEASGLERLNKYPKTSRYGRQNPKTEHWNSKSFMLSCRKSWEEACNQALEKAGIEERIDCRSYEEQGVFKIPKLSLSYGQVKMERRATRLKAEGKPEAEIIHTDISQINADILTYNHTIEALQHKIATKQENATPSLKEIRDQIIIVRTNRKKLRDNLLRTSSALESVQSRLDTYNRSVRDANFKIREHTDSLKELQEKLSYTHPDSKKHKALTEEIQNEKDIIVQLQRHIQELRESYGYSDESLYSADQKEAFRCAESLKDIEEKLDNLTQLGEELKEKYRETKSHLEPSPLSEYSYDNISYDINRSFDTEEYLIGDVAGLSYGLIHAFEDKKKKKRRR